MRKIDSPQHNLFVANGVDCHKPSKVAPTRLLTPFNEDDQERLNDLSEHVVDQLCRLIGEPYYAKDGFILYNSDTINFLSKLNASSFNVNLTLTSPPYNIGKEYENKLDVDQYILWCEQWLAHIYECTDSKGAFWLNLGYLEVPGKGLCVPIPYLLWDKSNFYFIQEVVWQYGAGVSSKKRLSPRNEKWLFYVKDQSQYTFNLDDIRDPNVKYPNQKKNGKFRCNPLGKNPSDVWEFPKVTTGTKRSSRERTGHPAQFPLGVVERIILASSNKFDIILDPFAGSCSTGIAAMGLGRIFIGVEINKGYCEMAKERFKNFLAERAMFREQNSILLLKD